MRSGMRLRENHPEDALEACPFCETRHTTIGGRWNWRRTFYWVHYTAGSLHKSGKTWELVSCMTCGGELYNGPARP